MTKYEHLIAEYEDEVTIEEHQLINDGLYCDDVIWVNRALPEAKKLCILAEELGHYYTTCGDILNQDSLNNIKQERKARAWAIDKLLPYEEFERALKAGYCTIPEIAEFLGVDVQFLVESIEHYQRKLGIEFPIMG